MSKPTYEQLEKVARAALENHNAIAYYTKYRDPQAQAVAIRAKVNCEKALVEAFGIDKVHGAEEDEQSGQAETEEAGS